MALALYIFFTCSALAQALDDGTAMLQVVSKGDQRSMATPAIKAPLPGIGLKFLDFVQALAQEKEKLGNATLLKLGENATGEWPSIPNCFGPFCEFQDTIDIAKQALRMAVDAMTESKDDQLRMSEEVNRAVEAYHEFVGKDGFHIRSATEEQLDDAKPALLVAMGVFKRGWERGVEIGQKNALRIQDFFVNGEGNKISQIDPRLLDLLSPDKILAGTANYTTGIRNATEAMAPEAKTVEDKTKQFWAARSALLKMQHDLDAEQQESLEGERSGSTKLNLGIMRVTMTSILGKDFMDSLEEMIDIGWQISHKTIDFTDKVSKLLLE